MTTTIVSAYFKIPSKKPHPWYRPYIENFIKNIQCECFFYTTQDVVDELKHIDNTYIKYVITELPSFTYFDDVFWARQIECDVEKYHTIELVKMWYAKKDFILRTISSKNAADNHIFVWCDAGCVRDIHAVNALRQFGRRSSETEMNDNKIHLQRIEFVRPQLHYTFNTVSIAGAIIAGNQSAWNMYKSIYDQLLINYDKAGISGSSDQYVTLSCVDKYPEHFMCHYPRLNSTVDKWFLFLETL